MLVPARPSTTAARHTNGGQITRVTLCSSVRCAISAARPAASAGVVCIFQFAATTIGRIGRIMPEARWSDRLTLPRAVLVGMIGQPLDPAEGALHGRPMDAEPHAELRKGRLGLLAPGIGDRADEIRLARQP